MVYEWCGRGDDPFFKDGQKFKDKERKNNSKETPIQTKNIDQEKTKEKKTSFNNLKDKKYLFNSEQKKRDLFRAIENKRNNFAMTILNEFFEESKKGKTYYLRDNKDESLLHLALYSKATDFFIFASNKNYQDNFKRRYPEYEPNVEKNLRLGINAINWDGKSVLYLALEKRYLLEAETLLQKGADVIGLNEQKNPEIKDVFKMILEKNYYSELKLLHKYKIMPEAHNEYLEISLRHKNHDIIEHILPIFINKLDKLKTKIKNFKWYKFRNKDEKDLIKEKSNLKKLIKKSSRLLKSLSKIGKS